MRRVAELNGPSVKCHCGAHGDFVSHLIEAPGRSWVLSFWSACHRCAIEHSRMGVGLDKAYSVPVRPEYRFRTTAPDGSVVDKYPEIQEAVEARRMTRAEAKTLCAMRAQEGER